MITTCAECHSTVLRAKFLTVMSVSYAPAKLRVPPGFEYVLEGLTREILREQPQDIVVFAAEYFKKKLTLRDGKTCDALHVPWCLLY